MTPAWEVAGLVSAALAEDIGPGDWTTLWTVPRDAVAEAAIVAKQGGIVAGSAPAKEAFRQVDPELDVSAAANDGERVEVGDVVLRVRGSAQGILTAERVALNFLQQLSGVASLTGRYVAAVQGTAARIIDTRKTTPGLRAMEKAAVVAGGGSNHRFGLHDMVMIKDNHIAAAGGIAAAAEAVRRQNRHGIAVEVETTNLDQVREALDASVDRILFDNMPLSLLREAVAVVHGTGSRRPETEASGGINLDTVRGVAETGVDLISVGALTHSAPALDLSLQLIRL